MVLPSQSTLKLKYVSEVCLEGWEEILLCLPLFYFEAVKHPHAWLHVRLKHGSQQREYDERGI